MSGMSSSDRVASPSSCSPRARSSSPEPSPAAPAPAAAARPRHPPVRRLRGGRTRRHGEVHRSLGRRIECEGRRPGRGDHREPRPAVVRPDRGVARDQHRGHRGRRSRAVPQRAAEGAGVRLDPTVRIPSAVFDATLTTIEHHREDALGEHPQHRRHGAGDRLRSAHREPPHVDRPPADAARQSHRHGRPRRHRVEPHDPPDGSRGAPRPAEGSRRPGVVRDARHHDRIADAGARPLVRARSSRGSQPGSRPWAGTLATLAVIIGVLLPWVVVAGLLALGGMVGRSSGAASSPPPQGSARGVRPSAIGGGRGRWSPASRRRPRPRTGCCSPPPVAPPSRRSSR